MRMGLAFACIITGTEEGAPLVDVSQTLNRLRLRPAGDVKTTKLQTLTPNSKLIIHHFRPAAPILTGYDAMVVHGWPRPLLEAVCRGASGITNRDLLDLAGNSFVGMVFAALLLSLLATLPSEKLAFPGDADDGDGEIIEICDTLASLFDM